jgi:isoamylase
MVRIPRTNPDAPGALGVTFRGAGQQGADVAVYAGHADAVELCIFDEDTGVTGVYVGTGPTDGRRNERRILLPHRRHGVHFGFVLALKPGSRYGFRVYGPWDPARGLRHNPAKLLLDPYARGLVGEVSYVGEVYGHSVHLPDATGTQPTINVDVRDDRDSAPFVPKSVALTSEFDWGVDRPPRVPWSQTVLYEAHVKGFTQRMPGVPAELRGTYAGLAHDAATGYLTDLGITTVELLPVQAFLSEPHLTERQLTNYWGYNTVGYFAPHAGYARSNGPAEVLAEFKSMVKGLHAAGLEVVLDVVYNHTCEQGRNGPTLSWRGLDNRAYYRLDDYGRDVDVTGCGNTLDFRHPQVVRLALDSLRYWVTQCHVDGFRFDLATALARGRDGGYDRDHPFLVALRADPVLSQVKLIAEPWDVGPYGWRTGQFPPPMAEWNDRYRDTVRTFWLADAARDRRGESGQGVQDLATRISGSADLFGSLDRGPTASINFIAAHDGYTLADAAAYEHKHNQANGEDNRDGHGDNRSYNHGWEGSTTDPAIAAARHQTLRNLLGTLLLSTGVPMLAAGDEFGRTQHGNNNAYCQDNELSWLDWNLADWQQDLLATTSALIRLRREHPALRQRDFFGQRPEHLDGTRDLQWFAPDGSPMVEARWQDRRTRTLTVLIHGNPVQGRSLAIVIHGGATATTVTLPGAPWAAGYELLWDSTQAKPSPADRRCPPGPLELPAHTLQLWAIN